MSKSNAEGYDEEREYGPSKYHRLDSDIGARDLRDSPPSRKQVNIPKNVDFDRSSNGIA